MSYFSNEIRAIFQDYYKEKKLWVKILYWGIFGFLLFISLDRAFDKGPGSDFYTFWISGNNFLTGERVYLLPNQPWSFLYPPFAAFLFASLGILPFKVAAVIQSIGNLIIWPLTFLFSILTIHQITNKKVPQMSLVLTFIFTFNFYLFNQNLLQVNTCLYLLVLIGLYSYLIRNYIMAGAFIAGAILFKVTPIIFLAWFFIRGKLKAFAYTLGFMALFIIIPLFARGFETGINDLNLFFQTLGGRIPELKEVSDYLNNNSIMGMLLNFNFYFNWFNQQWGAKLIQYVPFFMASVYIGWLVILRVKRLPVTEFEFVGTFLVVLLTSAVTRDAHMVTLSFVLLSFFSRAFRDGNRKLTAFLILIGLIFAIGRDLVGGPAFVFLLRQLNLYPLAMLALLIMTIIISLKSSKLKQYLSN